MAHIDPTLSLIDGARAALRHVALLAITWGLVGCVASSASEGAGGTDSNTHWLDHCDADAECGAGLDCLCGVCSRPCAADSACSELDADAVCVTRACEGLSGRNDGICSRKCNADAECGEATACESGECRPRAEQPSAEAGQSSPTSSDETASEPASSEPTNTNELPDGGPSSSGGGCESSDAGCPEPFVGADRLPAGCELLLPRATNSTCVGDAARCEQAQLDDRPREFRFQSDDPAALACAHGFLVASGFDATLGDTTVTVFGLAEDFTALLEASALTYDVACGGGACDYCFAAAQAECESDAFCAARNGAPIAAGATCREPARFVSCLPFDHGCDDAVAAARDERGQCWNLGALCYEPGLTYLDGSNSAESCQYYDQACDEGESLELTCRALETTTTNDGCSSPGLYSYDGEECYPLSCGCVGPDCDQIWASDGECETVHVACKDDLVDCEDLGLPLQTTPVASFGYASDTDISAFAEWTAAEWLEPLALPIDPEPCEPRELNGEADWCGAAVGLSLVDGAQVVVHLDVKAKGLDQIALESGAPIEFMLNEREFFVRDPVTQQPYLMIGNGANVDNPAAQLWTAGNVRIRAAAPYCRTAPSACGRVVIAQSLEIMTADTPLIERPFEEQWLQLAPLTGQDVNIDFLTPEEGLVSLPFHVEHGQSQYVSAGDCESEPRLDSFSLVRLATEP